MTIPWFKNTHILPFEAEKMTAPQNPFEAADNRVIDRCNFPAFSACFGAGPHVVYNLGEANASHVASPSPQAAGRLPMHSTAAQAPRALGTPRLTAAGSSQSPDGNRRPPVIERSPLMAVPPMPEDDRIGVTPHAGSHHLDASPIPHATAPRHAEGISGATPDAYADRAPTSPSHIMPPHASAMTQLLALTPQAVLRSQHAAFRRNDDVESPPVVGRAPFSPNGVRVTSPATALPRKESSPIAIPGLDTMFQQLSLVVRECIQREFQSATLRLNRSAEPAAAEPAEYDDAQARSPSPAGRSSGHLDGASLDVDHGRRHHHHHHPRKGVPPSQSSFVPPSVSALTAASAAGESGGFIDEERSRAPPPPPLSSQHMATQAAAGRSATTARGGSGPAAAHDHTPPFLAASASYYDDLIRAAQEPFPSFSPNNVSGGKTSAADMAAEGTLLWSANPPPCFAYYRPPNAASYGGMRCGGWASRGTPRFEASPLAHTPPPRSRMRDVSETRGALSSPRRHLPHSLTLGGCGSPVSQLHWHRPAPTPSFDSVLASFYRRRHIYDVADLLGP